MNPLLTKNMYKMSWQSIFQSETKRWTDWPLAPSEPPLTWLKKKKHHRQGQQPRLRAANSFSLFIWFNSMIKNVFISRSSICIPQVTITDGSLGWNHAIITDPLVLLTLLYKCNNAWLCWIFEDVKWAKQKRHFSTRRNYTHSALCGADTSKDGP